MGLSKSLKSINQKLFTKVAGSDEFLKYKITKITFVEANKVIVNAACIVTGLTQLGILSISSY